MDAHHIAHAQGMDADFFLCPLALAGAAAVSHRLGAHLLHGFKQHFGGAAGGIHFPDVVRFHDLNVRLGEGGRCLPGQTAQHRDAQTHIAGIEHRQFLGCFVDQCFFLCCMAGGADDHRAVNLPGIVKNIRHSGMMGKVDEHIGAAAFIGTTGHTPEEKELIYAAAQDIPVFYSGNMSLGIAVLCRLAAQAAAAFPEADIEIVEVHHNRKVDAPSGTAKMLFEAVKSVRPQATANCGRAGEGKREKDEIGIASLRMGGVVGIHEVHICTPSQTLTLRHEAGNRGMLAEGAVDAARFIVGKTPGIYTMNEML